MLLIHDLHWWTTRYIVRDYQAFVFYGVCVGIGFMVTENLKYFTMIGLSYDYPENFLSPRSSWFKDILESEKFKDVLGSKKFLFPRSF